MYKTKLVIGIVALMAAFTLVGCNNQNINNENNQNKEEHNETQNTISEEERIKSFLVNGGSWSPVSAYDLLNEKEESIFTVYGSSLHYSRELTFNEDGTFIKNIGSYAENYMGQYDIDVNTNTIHFTFETGMKMDGSYKYEEGKVVSVDIIEDYEFYKYRVTLTKNNKIENTSNEESNNDVEKSYVDPVYGTEISFEDKIEKVTEDGKRFYYSNVGKEVDVEIIGFVGNLKSANYITPEEMFEHGTLALLNTDGEIYAASKVFFDHSYTEEITVEKVNSKDKIKGISYVQTYTKAGNSGRVFLALTEKEELKYLDNSDLTLKDFSIENEKQYGKIFLDLVGKWNLDETLTSKDFKEFYYLGNDLQFGEHGEIFVVTSEKKIDEEYGLYEIIPEENAIIITYENGSSENCKLIYKEAINGANSSLILNGNDGIKAVWIKENVFNENIESIQ